MDAKQDIRASPQAHTPGPYFVKESSDGRLFVTTKNGNVSIATVTMGIGNARANGDLLAAAPALHEALRRILTYHSADEIEEQPALKRGLAAIASAAPSTEKQS